MSPSPRGSAASPYLLDEPLPVSEKAPLRWKEALATAVRAAAGQFDPAGDVRALTRALPKSDLSSLLEIAYLCASVRSESEFCSLLFRLKQIIPCEKILAALGPVSPQPSFEGPTKVVLCEFPIEWLSIYFHRSYAQIDPVLRLHLRTFQTQLWSSTFRSYHRPELGRFLEDARAFGLVEGITTGGKDLAYGIGTLISLVGPCLGEHPRHILAVELLRPHLHEALLRVGTAGSSGGQCRLSNREREVLCWIKEGKTNWEISKILGVSESTIKFHIKNILAKLDATTRGHAAALAVQHRLL
jgi:DNA-binding CsgD family transcriptional regulator